MPHQADRKVWECAPRTFRRGTGSKWVLRPTSAHGVPVAQRKRKRSVSYRETGGDLVDLRASLAADTSSGLYEGSISCSTEGRRRPLLSADPDPKLRRLPPNAATRKRNSIWPRAFTLRGRERSVRSRLNDPDYWPSRAEEVRTMAEIMSDPETQRIMLEIAESYERRGKSAAEREIRYQG